MRIESSQRRALPAAYVLNGEGQTRQVRLGLPIAEKCELQECTY